jgi:hypothetical protein
MATLVTGFVIDAIQQSASGVIGRRSARSAKPVAPRCRIPSRFATSVTAPAISWASTVACIAAVTPAIAGSAWVGRDAASRTRHGNRRARRMGGGGRVARGGAKFKPIRPRVFGSDLRGAGRASPAIVRVGAVQPWKIRTT